MTKRIQIGGSDFGELVRKDLLFVDKTLFIKEILDDLNMVTIITRPRRWGKTLNLSMLYYFLSAKAYRQETAGLFDALLIAKESGDYIAKYQGKYPVIFISLKDVKQTSFESAARSTALLIQDVYAEHQKIMESELFNQNERDVFQKTLKIELSIEDLSRSLRKLSEWLYRYYNQKVYILIDEYDTPLNFSYNQEYFDHMALFMKNFLSATLKDNPYLEKGVLTGILRISKDSMLSGLNNPKIHTMLEGRYHQHFGFTDAEVDALFVEQELTKDEASIKAWYNGYCLNGLTLYNPWSIMNSLDDGGLIRPYWLNTGDDSLLKKLLQQASSDVKTLFQTLVLGKTIKTWVNPTMRFDQVNTDKTMLWNLLISAGYLKALSATLTIRGVYECELAIPNREILGLYQGTFLEWVISVNQAQEILASLILIAEGRVTEFATSIEGFLKMAASIHDYANKPEAFYHGFMLALSVSLIENYYVFSNHESGLGRPDLVIIPKDMTQSQAVIIEFKIVTDNQTLQQCAEEGLAQIQARDYSSIIRQYNHINTVLQVGMAFDGKLICCVQEAHSL